MLKISTHVLDLSRGLPAAGIGVALESEAGSGFRRVSEAVTDSDGRVKSFSMGHSAAAPGRYRLTFALVQYFASHGVPCFFPEVQIIFDVRDPGEPHHVPLLLSPFGYSTYRGS